jgi:hypothetical protein
MKKNCILQYVSNSLEMREQTEAGNMMKAAVMAPASFALLQKARATVDCSKGNEPIKKLDHHHW